MVTPNAMPKKSNWGSFPQQPDVPPSERFDPDDASAHLRHLPIPSTTFHGTSSDIQGDKILPADAHRGRSIWGDTGFHQGQSSRQNTFSIPNETEAWEWGKKGVTGQPDAREPIIRNKVYEVTPGSNARRGYGISGEVVADYHTITKRHDIMPGHQGTFSELNWNQFKPRDEDPYDTMDANHPSDAAVKYGHEAATDGWTVKQVGEKVVDSAKADMNSDLQWDRGDRVTRESRRDRRFGEQGALFPEPEDVGRNRKVDAEIDHLRHLLTSPVQP